MSRATIVIDPRRTETAELADIHIQLRPGGDAWLLGAMLKILVSEGLADRQWLARHANGLDELTEMLSIVDVEQWCEKAGVTSAEVRHATTTIANAHSCAILEDLGIQMAPHSTLNSWLEKLIYILTANFGNKGGMNLHSRMGKLTGGGSRGRSPVGGHRILGDGAKVRLTTKRGETVTEIEISSTLQPGHVSLPNGTGLTYPDVAEDAEVGISPNELTSEEDRDWFAGTPWHKHVRARLEKV